jgi:regulator of protease activity HflC (stomatin/prohibitin superfamily)
MSIGKIVGSVVGGLFLIVVLTMGLANFNKVDATEHCVETRWGKVINPKVENGLISTITTDLTCFTTTEMQTDGETVEFLTRDSVVVKVELGLNLKYTDAFKAFETRRSHDAVMAEVANAVRSGSRDAGATIGIGDMMGAKRASLDELFREAINNQLGDYITVVKVYPRQIVIPARIQETFTATIAQQAEQQKARAKYVTDSLNARSTVINAQAAAEATRLTAQAMAVSPAVLKFRSDSVLAAGMKEICGRASTCVIGGTVADKFLTITPRN